MEAATTMIEIDPTIQVRVLTHQLAKSRQENERLALEYVRLLERANHAVIEKNRVLRQNQELLDRLDARNGYPRHLQLGYTG